MAIRSGYSHLHHNLHPYEHFITPQNEAGVTYISGWSEGVLRYVALDSFDLVEEIERISLDGPASRT